DPRPHPGRALEALRGVEPHAARRGAGCVPRRGRVVPAERRLAMILENGRIRTLEPSLPLARALAIAGDRIAGGVGVHETALASPEVLDLGGRCVLPGFTDSHVHFPTWALVQREVRLESAASLDEALALVAEAAA